MSERLDAIRAAVRGRRYTVTDELTLQGAIEADFRAGGVPFVREYPLSARDRVDFLVDDVAVEVKVGGSFSDVVRQLHRYAQHGIVREIVLLTTLSRHLRMPEAMNEKLVTAIHLSPIFGAVL